jgi:hypothetical protein
MKNAVFWDVMPCGSCKKRCIAPIIRLTRISKRGTTLAVNSNWPTQSNRIPALAPTQPPAEMITNYLLGGKGWPERKAGNLTVICQLSKQCGSLDISQPNWPPRPVRVTAVICIGTCSCLAGNTPIGLHSLLQRYIYFLICRWCSYLAGNSPMCLQGLLQGQLYYLFVPTSAKQTSPITTAN